MIRFFDIFFSILGIIILSPVLLLISGLIIFDSGGGVFYKQKRVGKNNRDFYLIKFRSMKSNSDKKGLLTVGANDSRITKIGLFIRKYKIDEIPQLLNVIKGDMSIAGPRPEVRKYVDLYTAEQLRILNIRPGISDFASIEYIDENVILGNSENPEQTYIKLIMPNKLKLNKKFIDNYNLKNYFKIIFLTIKKILV